MSLSQRLNKRITIQQKTAGQDGAGQPIDTWTTVATVWAEVKDVSGREFIAAQAGQAEVTTKVTIRYLAGIKSDMRVVHGADVYNIIVPLDAGDKRELLLMCSRGVSDG